MLEKTILIIICFSFMYFVNCLSEESKTKNSTTTPESEATVCRAKIDSYPNSFYNQTVEIDGEDMVFRVVNGRPAKLGSVPYQVGLFKRISFFNHQAFCGGTIIGQQKVLTAAHCFVNKKKSDCFKGRLSKSDFKNKHVVAGYLFTFGRRPLFGQSGSQQWMTIRRGKYPKTFKFPKDDIAVLYTVTSFSFDRNVSPIPYASVKKDYKGNCLVSGYGKINQYKQSDRLLLAEVEVLSFAKCSAIHRKIMQGFICTSDAVSDVHQGDSGGPIVCKGTGDPKDKGGGIVVGVTCGRTYFTHGGGSTYFTRITRFYNFVNRCSSLRFSYTLVFLFLLINSLSLF